MARYPSRRAIIAGGAAAAVAIPGLQYGFWRGRNFSRDAFPGADWIDDGEGREWTNWAGTQKATPNSIATPASEDELVSLMKTAKGAIRPVGSAHSWAPLVPTEGTIVDISRFNGLIAHDAASQTVKVGAGTRLMQAARLFNDVGLALDNMPDINMQTLAGSFSTATHGTGRALPAIHHHIVGFRLATPTGELIDVTRESNPELFSAGRVSLGALGVITQFTLRLEKAYNLRRQVWIEPLDDLLEREEEYYDNHRNFEFWYSPNTRKAMAVATDLHQGPVSGRPKSGDEDTLAALKELRDQFGWLPRLRRAVINKYLPNGVIEDASDEGWKMLSTPRPTKIIETEYQIPKENGLKALRELVAAVEKRKSFYFPIEFRHIAPDDAWLSPFNDGHRVSISFHTPVDEDYSLHKDLAEPVMRKHGGRPHWGKVFSLNGAELAALYPKFGEFNALRRDLDPQGRMLNPFLRSIFESA